MSLAKEAVVTKHIAYKPFDQWVDEESKIVLVGDAAHPLCVCRFDPFAQ
jgi:2-polyprenyl-6-methoxyphenol hydroxylase-like FAD-dependent oxidoreductase